MTIDTKTTTASSPLAPAASRAHRIFKQEQSGSADVARDWPECAQSSTFCKCSYNEAPNATECTSGGFVIVFVFDGCVDWAVTWST